MLSGRSAATSDVSTATQPPLLPEGSNGAVSGHSQLIAVRVTVPAAVLIQTFTASSPPIIVSGRRAAASYQPAPGPTATSTQLSPLTLWKRTTAPAPPKALILTRQASPAAV